MIRLTLLGPVELVRADGAAVLSVLAQPKPLALLAYLAVARPTGFQRRDALAALLWPDLDGERARANLRKGLHRIRKSLGDEALLTRGDEEVALDTGRVRCDVTEVRSRIETGDAEGVLELYRGPLLPGFHVDDALPFMTWLDEERRALTRAAREAAETLARSRLRAGDAAGGLRAAERAVAVEPLSEAATRTLMEVADAAGNRARALTAYETLARSLSDDLGVEPSPETGRLAARIEGRTEPYVPEMDVAGAGQDIPSDLREAPEPPPPGAPPRRAFLRRGVAAVVVLVPVLVFNTLAGDPGRRPAGDPPLAGGAAGAGDTSPGDLHSGSRLVVAPLENRTGSEELATLGRLAAEWIAQGLLTNAVGEVVSPAEALRVSLTLESHRGLGPGPQHSTALARETGARLLVSGSLRMEEGRLALDARVTDAASGRLLRAMSASAPTGNAETAVVELADAVVGGVATLLDPRTRSTPGAASQPPSPRAYRLYVEGIQRFIEPDYPAATTAMLSAWDEDPTFTGSLVWAALAADNAGDTATERELVRELEELREEMLPWDQALADYKIHDFRGEWEEAHRAGVRLIRIAPDSEWHFKRAVPLLKLGRYREAAEALEEIDPERGWIGRWPFFWQLRASVLHVTGDCTGELAFVEEAPEPWPAMWTGRVRGLACLGRTDRLEEELARARASLPGDFALFLHRLAGQELRIHRDDAEARRMWEAGLAWASSRPDAARDPAFSYQRADLLRLTGRLHEAERSFLDLLPHVEAPGTRALIEVRIATMRAARGDTATASRLREELASREIDTRVLRAWLWAAAGRHAEGADRMRGLRPEVPPAVLHRVLESEDVFRSSPLYRGILGGG